MTPRPDTPPMTNRLKEAREYVGLTLLEIAGFLYVDVEDITRLEAGNSLDFVDSEWDRLGKLYRRPVAWLRGHPMPSVEISPELHDLIEQKSLSEGDRREIIAFAEWLHHSRQEPRP